MNWDELEAIVQGQNVAQPDKPLEHGERVAWVMRVNGRTDHLSSVHCHIEDGRTFCNLAVPERSQHIPILPSLRPCRRCRVVLARIAQFRRREQGLRASA